MVQYDDFESSLQQCIELLEHIEYEQKTFCQDTVANVVQMFNQLDSADDYDAQTQNLTNQMLTVVIQLTKQSENFRLKYDEALVAYVHIMGQIGREIHSFTKGDYSIVG